MSRHAERRSRRRRLIVWSLIGLCVLGLGGTVVGYWTAGYRPYVVHTGSMSPTYRPGDLIIDRPAGGPYIAGEVITFRHSADADDVVTHRITEVRKDGLIRTKGDANRTPDAWKIPPEMVVGSVAASVPLLGYAAVFFQQPTGIAAVLTAILAIYLLWGVFFPPQRRTGEQQDANGAGEPAGHRVDDDSSRALRTPAIGGAALAAE